MSTEHERLEYLRGELRAERISYGELAELQGLASFIDPGDVELLEAAGVPEHGPTGPTGVISATDYVVISLTGWREKLNQPSFTAKAYGPFPEEEAEQRAGDILHLEGGCVLVRPLVDWYDTIRRISAD